MSHTPARNMGISDSMAITCSNAEYKCKHDNDLALLKLLAQEAVRHLSRPCAQVAEHACMQAGKQAAAHTYFVVPVHNVITAAKRFYDCCFTANTVEQTCMHTHILLVYIMAIVQ